MNVIRPATPANLRERFEQKFTRSPEPDGCWPWHGGKTSRGYGQIRPEGKRGPQVYAHRLSYEFYVGPIPDGLQLDHGCRNPPCVNPDHLEPVTNRENTLRGLKGRLKQACAQGHPWVPENWYLQTHRSGRVARSCLICRTERSRARRT